MSEASSSSSSSSVLSFGSANHFASTSSFPDAPSTTATAATNGHHHHPHVMATPAANGSSSSSPSSPSTPIATPRILEFEMGEYLARCYRTGEFADLTLRIVLPDGSLNVFSLHGIIIARSPFFANFLRSSPRDQRQPSVRGLELFDSNITFHGLNLALAYLYSPQSIPFHINPLNAREVLAASRYLQIDSLSDCAIEVLSRAIADLTDSFEFQRYFAFLEAGSKVMARMNGGAPPSPDLVGDVPYSSWGRRLSDELWTRLVEKLPQELLVEWKGKGSLEGTGSSAGLEVTGMKALIDVLASVPFLAFKTALESNSFPMTDMDRFSLGKKVVAERKKRRGNASEFDEHVVLQFGVGSSGVNVLRKAKRRVSALWKINDGSN